MVVPGFRKMCLSVSIMAYLSGVVVVDGAAYAQDRRGWGDGGWSRDCSRYENRDSRWCRHERDDERRRRDDERARREHDRHKNDVAKGAVAGAVGVLVVGGLVAALASSGKKDKEKRERQRYCVARYGNYDERSDSYRASDGRWYPCE